MAYEVRRQKLHGDRQIEKLVMGGQDGAHPTLADERLDAVLAREELTAWRWRWGDRPRGWPRAPH
jgi:hypothetical protein